MNIKGRGSGRVGEAGATKGIHAMASHMLGLGAHGRLTACRQLATAVVPKLPPTHTPTTTTHHHMMLTCAMKAGGATSPACAASTSAASLPSSRSSRPAQGWNQIETRDCMRHGTCKSAGNPSQRPLHSNADSERSREATTQGPTAGCSAVPCAATPPLHPPTNLVKSSSTA